MNYKKLLLAIIIGFIAWLIPIFNGWSDGTNPFDFGMGFFGFYMFDAYIFTPAIKLYKDSKEKQ